MDSRFRDFNRGDTKTFLVKVSNAISEDPTDITGYQFEIILKHDKMHPDDDQRAITFTKTVPATAESADGIYRLTLETTETATIHPRKYWMKIRMVQPATSPETVTTLHDQPIEVLW